MTRTFDYLISFQSRHNDPNMFIRWLNTTFQTWQCFPKCGLKTIQKICPKNLQITIFSGVNKGICRGNTGTSCGGDKNT